MFPIAEVFIQSDENYRSYVGKKTGFLLTSIDGEQLIHFWYHICRGLTREPRMGLSQEQFNTLDQLFLQFGYIHPSQMTPSLQQLEQDMPWIFKHPAGGIFLPLEVFKTFMTHDGGNEFQSYLFTLLFRLKLKEQRNLVALLGGELEAQLSLTFENNALDMALVLYIWYAGLHLSGDALLPAEGKIIAGPWSLSPENESTFAQNEIKLPKKPVAMWPYLFEQFSFQKAEIEELRHRIENTGRGFYRSLSLVKNTKGLFYQMFRQGFLIPIMGRDWRNGRNPDDLTVVSPRELVERHQNTNK